MDRLTPIRTPPWQLWREFRIRLFPWCVFVAGLAAVGWLWRDQVAAPTMWGEVETVRANCLKSQVWQAGAAQRDPFTAGSSGRSEKDAELQASSPEAVLAASMKVQEEKLRLTVAELRPVELTARIDASVSAIHHHSGEAVLAGEPIVTITSTRSDRILSYLRQPFPIEPRVGMKVEVRARSQGRCVSQGQIIEVGSQMEPISATLSPVSNGKGHEVGLPVLVSIPPSQTLFPGEIVDLRIVAEPSALKAGSITAVP